MQREARVPSAAARCNLCHTLSSAPAPPSVEEVTRLCRNISSSQIFISPAEPRKNNCLFCMRRKTLLWRHQRTIHADEAQVRSIVKLKKEEEIKRRIGLLRLRGNFEHNRVVLQRGSGELIVSRRPSAAQHHVSSFVPCPHCLTFLLESDLQCHLRKNTCLQLQRGAAADEEPSTDEPGNRTSSSGDSDAEEPE